MNSSLRTFLGLALLVAPLSAGCASRTAPFDRIEDQAQITVLRLTAPPPPAAATPAATPGALPGIPGLPIPPEMQAAGQQLLQGLGQAAPGLIRRACSPARRRSRRLSSSRFRSGTASRSSPRRP